MQLNVALIRMVFPDRSASELREVLKQARSRGADLAVLPELPLNVWSPASKVFQDDESEPPAGPRHQAMGDAARVVGTALIGGAIGAALTVCPRAAEAATYSRSKTVLPANAITSCTYVI